MLAKEQKARAKEFVEKWSGKNDEKEHCQLFWIDLLQDVFGIKNVSEYISFEDKVKLGHTSFIDARIKSAKVLIEQKSGSVDLRSAAKQSDGTLLTPYQQAKRYASELPVSEHPRWIVCCNFKSFLVYDMDALGKEPEEILLADLPKEYNRLNFLLNETKVNLQREMEISIQAGELVGKIYEALFKEFPDKNSIVTHRSINTLCVRLVFCLYAEDSGIFGHDMFSNYVNSFHAENVDLGLKELFKILNTKEESRSPLLKDKLKCFPYVNGGLFDDGKLDEDSILIPPFSEETKKVLVEECGFGFDWSGISPTIFGAVFESTLNPETRRHGGMHYTSIENIHKVIDPLFLNSLNEEFESLVSKKGLSRKAKREALEKFRDKISKLKFLDPACGSGNFLTESFMSLRRLENKALRELREGSAQMELGGDLSPVKVSIHQFFGIEINDFAATVAMTALWIAECQMLQETEDILGEALDFLPLKNYANIVLGNALKIDWKTLKANESLGGIFADAEKSEDEIHYDYIMGNPPFVGYSLQSKGQKEDVASIMPKGVKNVDYVALWYYKAARLIQNTATRCAFVSTNSICQGEQVTAVWKHLFEEYGITIDFAYRTFRWDSESTQKAHVHCVIVGFSMGEAALGEAASRRLSINSSSGGDAASPKRIFDGEKVEFADNINAYLLNAPNVWIDKRTTPLCDVPQFVRGCQPTDDGNLILTNEEKEQYLKNEPQAEKFLRPFMMGKDFIDRKPRWCFWLVEANPSDLRKCHSLLGRIENVRKFRQSSTKPATQKKAETPTLFDEIREPQSDYVALPTVSSEGRRYIPIDFLPKEVIPGNKIYFLQGATLYHFGVLVSSVHMAWMRAVCGRLEMRYNYSNTIVYNNFPWPGKDAGREVAGKGGLPTVQETKSGKPSVIASEAKQSSDECVVKDCFVAGAPRNDGAEQRAKIARTAQGILDARAMYPDCSLADLYDETTMPPELRKAHRENDLAVMEAYGFSPKMTESEIVAELFKMYEELVGK
ncbi:DNA methyltransferase [uncultured Fibrobacter sp.]|uniref:DNA methyltransferase n=1 Tax=uncultured Fibrobacter sp. TaxID=261512 RepID=UPI0028050563|nr:DNA methyltransferase [uncultured Fibrobacter sp.]